MSDNTAFDTAGSFLTGMGSMQAGGATTGMGNGIDRDGICHDGSETKGGISKGTSDC